MVCILNVLVRVLRSDVHSSHLILEQLDGLLLVICLVTLLVLPEVNQTVLDHFEPIFLLLWRELFHIAFLHLMDALELLAGISRLLTGHERSCLIVHEELAVCCTDAEIVHTLLRAAGTHNLLSFFNLSLVRRKLFDHDYFLSLIQNLMKGAEDDGGATSPLCLLIISGIHIDPIVRDQRQKHCMILLFKRVVKRR